MKKSSSRLEQIDRGICIGKHDQLDCKAIDTNAHWFCMANVRAKRELLSMVLDSLVSLQTASFTTTVLLVLHASNWMMSLPAVV